MTVPVQGSLMLTNIKCQFTFFEYLDEHRTRGHSLELQKHRSRLDLRRHFFSEWIVNVWNKLDGNTVTAPTLNCFKRHLETLHNDESFTRLSVCLTLEAEPVPWGGTSSGKLSGKLYAFVFITYLADMDWWRTRCEADEVQVLCGSSLDECCHRARNSAVSVELLSCYCRNAIPISTPFPRNLSPVIKEMGDSYRMQVGRNGTRLYIRERERERLSSSSS